MKKHPIFYLPAAQKDLESIFDYIQKDSPKRAAQFLSKIDQKILRLELFPLSGKVTGDPYIRSKKFRMIVIGNYLVFYRFERKSIIIHRILHGKRKYSFLLRSK